MGQRWTRRRKVGWDWFALQLNDGAALMFYALRDRDGARDPHSAGTWIGLPVLRGRLGADAVTIEVTAAWRMTRRALPGRLARARA